MYACFLLKLCSEDVRSHKVAVFNIFYLLNITLCMLRESPKKAKQADFPTTPYIGKQWLYFTYLNLIDIFQISPDNLTALLWKGFPTNNSSACGNISGTYLGGLKLFQKDAYATLSYNNLPPHYRLEIRLRFLRIDNWSTKKAFILLNNKEIFSS